MPSTSSAESPAGSVVSSSEWVSMTLGAEVGSGTEEAPRTIEVSALDELA